MKKSATNRMMIIKFSQMISGMRVSQLSINELAEMDDPTHTEEDEKVLQQFMSEVSKLDRNQLKNYILRLTSDGECGWGEIK